MAEAARRDVPVYGEWIGVLTGFINADIRPQVKGYVLERLYREGEAVRPGQVLFLIDPREFQAQLQQAEAQLAQNLAVLRKHELDVERYTPLAREGAVSRQELDNAIQAREAARAAVESGRAAVAQARLNLEWTRVASPIEGVAGIAQAQVGDLVDPTTLMTTVSQLDPIKVRFPIAEQEYLRFARARGGVPDSDAGDVLELILADGTVHPRRGRVSAVGREVDPGTGTLLVEGVFPNPGNVLRPGGYARVRARIDLLRDAVVVPGTAVTELQGTPQVAVVRPDGTVEMRAVRVGPAAGPDVVILEGVAPGERVVVEGLQKVRPGGAVAPRPYGPPTPAPTGTA